MEEKKNVKVKVKKKPRNTGLVPVVITVTTLSVFVLILNAGNLSNLMNNSVGNYYCKDETYTLNGKMCEKYIISKPLLLGDVDLDGQITNKDLNIVKKYVKNKAKIDDTELLVADVDKNKVLNNRDVTKLETYIKDGHKEYVCQKDFKYKDKNVCIKAQTTKAIKK